MKTAPCRSCGAPMVWCRTVTGKRNPMDPEPSEGDREVARELARHWVEYRGLHDRGLREGADAIAQALAAARAEGAEAGAQAERRACHDEAADVARVYSNFSGDEATNALASRMADIVRTRIAARGPLAPAPSAWQPIETAPDGVTVLTQHEEDLFPVPAFCLVDGGGVRYWLLETEGPEDTYDKRPDRHRELYRKPTHWMPLPLGPASAPKGEE